MKLIAIVTITLVATASSMLGGVITQTLTFGPANTDVTSAQTAETFSFFQSATGYVAGDTLNSVTLQITTNQAIANGSFTNNASSPETFTYSIAYQNTVGGTALAGDITSLNSATGFTSPATIFSQGESGVAAGGTVTASGGTDTLGTGVITSSNAAFYGGTGTFSLNYSTQSGGSFFGGGGNILPTGFAVTTGATYTVIYNYTAPVGAPEPGTITLFGSALVGLGFFARKRFTKKA